VLLYLAFNLVAANLLVERVEQLLACGCACKSGAMVQRSAKASKIQQTFRSAIERNAHPIEQVNDSRCGLAHCLNRCLVGKKIATVNCVVKVLGGSIAFALQILCGVDAALCANRMRALHRDNRKQIDSSARLGNFDYCCQACQASADHNDSGCCHKPESFQSKTAVSFNPSAFSQCCGYPILVALYAERVG